MFALALLPLVFYFVFLTGIHFRRSPTVLNGSLDFILLSWGVFGFMTFGLGRLVIPLYVFAAWGMYIWLFWTGFYFVISYRVALQFKNRLIVYHCQRETVLPAFFDLVRQIDPKADWSGNVLSLHGLNVQWAVTGDRYGGHLLFVPTNPDLINPHQEMLQKQLTNICRMLTVPKKKIRWYLFFITFSLFCYTIGTFVQGYPVFLQQLNGYWLPQ